MIRARRILASLVGMALSVNLLSACQQTMAAATTAESTAATNPASTAGPASTASTAPTANPPVDGARPGHMPRPAPPPAAAPPTAVDPAGTRSEPQAPVKVPGGTLSQHGVALDGWARTWSTFKPDGMPDRHPLLIVLHGRGGTGRAMEQLGLDQLAVANGVEVAYPDAVDGSWNDGRTGVQSLAALQPVDDLTFVKMIIEDGTAHDGVNPNRVAIVGHSNGALMASSFACRHAELLSVVVMVSGAGGDNLPASCHPTRPLSVLEIHGDHDRVVPFDGGPVASADGRSRGAAAPVPAVLDIWRRTDSCPPATNEHLAGSPWSVLEHTTCPEGREVTLQLVAGGNHSWRLAPGFDTDSTVWAFLIKHGITSS